MRRKSNLSLELFGDRLPAMQGSGGEYKLVKSIEDGNTDSYVKYDLKSGSTYKFRVRAYTQVGDKKTFGAYSNEVSVKVK